MNFLIDTNICSAYIKGNRTVWSRFLQHAGGMALSVVTVGELWTWAKRAKTRPQARNAVAEGCKSALGNEGVEIGVFSNKRRAGSVAQICFQPRIIAECR